LFRFLGSVKQLEPFKMANAVEGNADQTVD
jgi:hypothetical protein